VVVVAHEGKAERVRGEGHVVSVHILCLLQQGEPVVAAPRAGSQTEQDANREKAKKALSHSLVNKVFPWQR
jgi:hypothetical protein